MKYFTRYNEKKYNFADYMGRVREIPSDVAYREFYEKKYNERLIRISELCPCDGESARHFIQQRTSWCKEEVNTFLPSIIASEIDDYFLLSIGFERSCVCTMLKKWSLKVIKVIEEVYCEYDRYIKAKQMLFDKDTQNFNVTSFHDLTLAKIVTSGADKIIEFEEDKQKITLKKVISFQISGDFKSRWTVSEIYFLSMGKINLQVLLEQGELDVVCESICVEALC